MKRWIKMYGVWNIMQRVACEKLPIVFVTGDKRVRRLIWQTRVKKKIQKYKVITLKDEERAQSEYPKTVWWMWFQGVENAPDIVKKCHESVCFYASQAGYSVIELDSNNLKKYVHLPEYIYQKWDDGKIGNAHFSDLCRVALLAEYGGIWTDATVLLTGIIPDEIRMAPLFFFQASFLDLSATQISSWFIAAKEPQNPFLLSLRDSLFLYWKHNNVMPDYFLFHIYAAMLSDDSDLKQEFNTIPFMSNTYPLLLLNELNESYDKNKYDHILAHSSIHKLTYKDIEKDRKDTFYSHIMSQNAGEFL